MSQSTDRKEQILDTAEELLRKHGIAKTSVVDVARALDLSHAAVYKYFDSKIALQEAVAERWLHRISAPLARISAREGDAVERLRDWVHTLIRLKQKKVLDDSEMFATYHALAETADGAVTRHVDELIAQLERIVADGLAAGQLHATDARSAAWAVLNATARFHHPHFVIQYRGKTTDAEVDAVLNLLIAGLKAGAI